MGKVWLMVHGEVLGVQLHSCAHRCRPKAEHDWLHLECIGEFLLLAITLGTPAVSGMRPPRWFFQSAALGRSWAASHS